MQFVDQIIGPCSDEVKPKLVFRFYSRIGPSNRIVIGPPENTWALSAYKTHEIQIGCSYFQRGPSPSLGHMASEIQRPLLAGIQGRSKKLLVRLLHHSWTYVHPLICYIFCTMPSPWSNGCILSVGLCWVIILGVFFFLVAKSVLNNLIYLYL